MNLSVVSQLVVSGEFRAVDRRVAAGGGGGRIWIFAGRGIVRSVVNHVEGEMM